MTKNVTQMMMKDRLQKEKVTEKEIMVKEREEAKVKIETKENEITVMILAQV